jgi:hypothetical protein
MKKILLLITLLSNYTFGQMTQTNEPNYGVSKLMYVCDSNATNYSTITGNNVTWDYSQLAGVGSLTETVSLDTIDVNTIDSSFIGSTKKYSIGTTLKTFYNSTATSRISQGFIFYEATLGDVPVKWNSDAEKLVDYPFALTNSFNDIFSGVVETAISPTASSASGSCSASIDGIGTLILQQNTYNNITRYHFKDSILTNVSGFPVSLVRNWYEYYDLNTGNYLPLFILVNLKVYSAIINSETSLVLSSDQPSSFVGINDNSNELKFVYPNPANDILNISTNGEILNVVISTLDCRVVKNSTLSTVDVSTLSPGIYIYNVNVDGKVAKGNFVKN